MQIGEVATRVGLSLRTIRYYGEVGLVVPSARSAGGFRLYTEEDVQRLFLIKSLKPLEFSLEQMRDLVETMANLQSLDVEAEPDKAELLRGRLAMYRAAADSRVEVLRAQVEGLTRLSGQLKALTARKPRQVARRSR